ncbi:3-ketoacyl-CoA reductase [Clavulina sp. PMI_390]|nr:3-ketoacyl-CoA reductase [Clavulina sp. PMI_390]
MFCWVDLVKHHSALTLFAALLGTVGVAKFAYSFSQLILQTFILPGKSLSSFGAKKGAWAVVTGATDGIGREFANQLAKAGFNILLVSRTPEKLAAAASEIETKYKVSTKIHALDFSNADDAAFDKFAEAVNGLDIGVLINNVGRSHQMPVYFADTELSEMKDIIQINVFGTVRITHIILPTMLAKKKGLILNLSSFAAAVPSPMLATYAGSKGFVNTWSQALGEEVRKNGITVQLVNAFFIVSAMSKIRKPSISTPMPKEYVRSVLANIGKEVGSVSSNRPGFMTPYWSHAIGDWVMTQVGWMSMYMRYTHVLHISIRKRALKKKEREAAAAKTQ